MAGKVREEFLGIAQWLKFTLKERGVGHIDFATYAGIPNSTMADLLAARAAYNRSQVLGILRGLEKIGILMTEEEFAEKIIACQPTQVYPTVKSFVQAWKSLPDGIRQKAALTIGQHLLEDYATLTDAVPARTLIKQAEKRVGRTLQQICGEYDLPYPRMLHLRQGYKVLLSPEELEAFAEAILPAPRKQNISEELEGLLMPNRKGSPDKFVDLIDRNFAILEISNIEDLAGLIAENKCSLPEEEVLDLLQQFYLEREPIDLDDSHHTQFLVCLAVTLVKPNGEPFNGSLSELVGYCGIKRLRDR